METKVMEALKKVNEGILTYEGISMVGDGIIDSFEVVDIVCALEEAFDIEINVKYIVEENFANKDTICTLIKKILGE